MPSSPHRRVNPLADPDRQPAGTVPMHCTGCGRWVAWCSPPAPSCRVVCTGCRDAEDRPDVEPVSDDPPLSVMRFSGEAPVIVDGGGDVFTARQARAVVEAWQCAADAAEGHWTPEVTRHP